MHTMSCVHNHAQKGLSTSGQLRKSPAWWPRCHNALRLAACLSTPVQPRALPWGARRPSMPGAQRLATARRAQQSEAQCVWHKRLAGTQHC